MIKNSKSLMDKARLLDFFSALSFNISNPNSYNEYRYKYI